MSWLCGITIEDGADGGTKQYHTAVLYIPTTYDIRQVNLTGRTEKGGKS